MWTILLMAAVCAAIIFSLGFASTPASPRNKEEQYRRNQSKAAEAAAATVATSRKPVSPADMATRGDSQDESFKSDRNKLITTGQ